MPIFVRLSCICPVLGFDLSVLKKKKRNEERSTRCMQARLIIDIKDYSMEEKKSVTINQQFKHINFVPDHIEEKFIDEM